MFSQKIRLLTAALALTGAMVASVSGANQTITVPRRAVQPDANVAIIKDNTVNVSDMVSQALTAALGPGGISNLVQSGQTVLIKPNLVSNKAAAVTDWRIVKALVDQIKTVNGGAAITIAEGCASNTSTSNTKIIMAAQGYTAENFPGVELVDLNDLNECPTDNFVLTDGSSDNTTKRVAERIRLADVYINVPKMKTHWHAGYTGAVKNIGIGTPSWPNWNVVGSNTNKGGLHNDIRREIMDHILCRVPDFTVMDAISPMEGQGPASGTSVTMNLVLASKDPVALDEVACNIMNIPSYLITHLVLCANENVGILDLNHIAVTGNTTIDAVKRTFLRATAGSVVAPYELASIPYRATTVIRTAPADMNIDGVLNEWGYANCIDVNAADQVKSGNTWNGPSDCSLNGLFMYDQDNLYFAANVYDNAKLNNSATDASIRNGESIELYLSTYSPQYDNNHGTTYMSQYDHALCISYATTPQAYLFSHNRSVSGFVASKIETSYGYVIEAKIPLSNFNNFTLSRYRQIGLNVKLNDADVSSSTVDRRLYWNCSSQSDVETNPQRLGMSYLDPTGGIYGVNTYSLNVNSTNGTVAKNPEGTTYNAYSVVTLTPTPDQGFSFNGWGGDASGNSNPLTVFIRKNQNITASFVAASVLSSITVSPQNAAVNATTTRQFSAIAYDQNNNPLSVQPTFTWSVSGNGTITSSGLFTAGTAAGSAVVTATVGGISGTATVNVVSEPSIVYQINTGSSSAASPFSADQYGSGGTQRTVTNTIDRSGVTDPAPQAVYQSERYGNSTYTIPNLTALAQYKVRLHFAELYQTATGRRVFNVAINGTTVLSNFDIFAAAGANYKAVVREFTATANGTGQIVITFTTVTDNATIEGIEIIRSIPNAAPTIEAAASASPSTVSATTTALSVLGTDDNGESNLIYTWATSGTPPASVTFSANGTNAAKNTVATFTKAGDYAFQVTVRDAENATATSTVNVRVDQTLTSIAITPSSATVNTLATQQFSAAARDQFSTNLITQPTITWTVSGAGTIDASGLFTAGAVAGTATVTAAAGEKSAVATITVVKPNEPPTIATAASASPSPVTGTTTALSVLGADDNGESNLTYTWATTGTPPASVSFSVNGTNAAKNAVATFTRAGNYSFQVTVRDAGNLTVTSPVDVTVNQTLTSIVVSPSSATINTSATQQFSAVARDQFTVNMTTQPVFTWSVSGVGTVSSSGLFSAGATAGTATVRATSAAVYGTASVTVNSLPTTVYQINVGSTSAASPFKADQYGSGGTTRTVTNSINTSGVTSPAPQAVYQSERYGNSTYTMPNLTAQAQYKVRLHFAELYQTAAGRRVFNVAINGTTVLSNFDIFAAAGANYKAVVREFTATANASGQIVITFTTVTDNATIEGIEIIRN